MKNIQKFKKILDSMTVTELEAPEQMNALSRERIAKLSGHVCFVLYSLLMISL